MDLFAKVYPSYSLIIFDLYKIILCAVSFFILVSVVISVVPFQAFGDGFTQENVYASIGNRKMAMFVKINPPILTSQNLQDRYLLLRFFDAETNNPIKNVSFFLNVTKGNQLLMYDLFYTQNGTIELKFQPGGTVGKWKVYGDQEPTGAGWTSPTNQVNVQAPILSEGGLYHFNMELSGFDYPNEIVIPYGTKVKFDSYLSVGDIYNQTINYNSKPYDITLVSYYDKITNINFDQTKVQLSWSMPFDWDLTKYKDRRFLIHEELRVPNSFKEFVNNPVFSAIVNGEPLIPEKIVQDSYSFNNTTILHLYVNIADIQQISKIVDPSTKTMDFVVYPSKANVTTSTGMFTDFGGWQVKLGWLPIELDANQKETLQLTFFDQLTGQQVTDDVNYNLKILDTKGNRILSQSNLTARGGIDTQSIFLPENGIYHIQASVTSVISNGISDTSRNGVARGNLVIPSVANETIPEFPSVTIPILIGFVSLLAFTRIRNGIYC